MPVGEQGRNAALARPRERSYADCRFGDDPVSVSSRRTRRTPRPRGTALMKCPRCQHENPPFAKFCLKCGARLACVCAKCHGELPAGARFCSECGEPVATSAASRFATPEAYTPKHLAEKILTSKTALEGERKQVTVLFADLQGLLGAARRPRCRGSTQTARRGGRADDGGRPSLRRHRQ